MPEITKSVKSSPDTTSAVPLIGWRFFRNVVIKGLILFCLANLLFAAWYPLDELGEITAYNSLFPGRQRLPYGDHPERAYNLSLYNLNAMFASHELSARGKPTNEYRVLLIGDSATWGYLLPVEQTLAANLNQRAITTPSGKQIRFYNLGYPVMSLTKDLLLLSYAMRYEPDLIIWLVTLESFPIDKQLYPPLVQNNPQPVRQLIKTYHLNLDMNDPSFQEADFWQRTLIGARRPLAEWTAAFDAAGMWWAPVQTIGEMLDDPQVRAAGAVIPAAVADGTAEMVASPAEFAGTPCATPAMAPELGQHTEAVLLELGYDWELIAALRDAGALG